MRRADPSEQAEVGLGVEKGGLRHLPEHREEDRLEGKGFWPENGVKMTKTRIAATQDALADLARFTGVSRIEGAVPSRRAKAS